MSEVPNSQDWDQQYRSKAPKLPAEGDIDDEWTEEFLAFKVQRVHMKVGKNHAAAILKF